MKKIRLVSLFLYVILITLTIGCSEDEGPVIREDLIGEEQENNDNQNNNNNNNNTVNNAEPLFEFSIAGTGIDYIKSTDPDTFLGIEYKGQFTREIPGVEPLVDDNAYVFEASFTEGKKIEIRCRSNFGSLEKATDYANKLTDKLGKLPIFMRDELSHVAVFSGESRASAEPAGKFFFISDQRIDKRISDNQLEETVFHESVHVYFENRYSRNTEWLDAQKKDASFVTEYAESLPTIEDIPETAIFVYTIKKYPGRLSKEIEDWVETNIPNRFKFLETFFKD
jgi:hypothetical protein